MTTTAPSPHEWNWRKDLMYLCVASTEILWVAPIFYFLLADLFGDISLQTTLAYLSVNIFAAMVLRRWMIHHHWNTNQQFPLMLVSSLFSFFASIAIMPLLSHQQPYLQLAVWEALAITPRRISYGIWLLPMVLWLWFRGFAIGRRLLTVYSVSFQMRWGILVFFFVAIFSNADFQAQLLPLVPIFFTVALLATALTRTATLKIEDADEKTRFGGSWLGFLIAVVLCINSVGFIIALLLADLEQSQFFAVFQITAAVIGTILFILAAPFLYLLEVLFRRFDDTDESPPFEFFRGRPDPGPARDTDRLEYGNILDMILDIFKDSIGIIFATFVIGIILYFWLSFFLVRDNMLISDDDKDPNDARERLKPFRRLFLNRFRKWGETWRLFQRLGLGNELFGALTVRWAYARMENMAKKRGYPRINSQTPYEYRSRLLDAYPGGEREIRIITDAYIKVRYGEIPEDSRELDTVREALRILREIHKPISPEPNP